MSPVLLMMLAAVAWQSSGEPYGAADSPAAAHQTHDDRAAAFRSESNPAYPARADERVEAANFADDPFDMPVPPEPVRPAAHATAADPLQDEPWVIDDPDEESEVRPADEPLPISPRNETPIPLERSTSDKADFTQLGPSRTTSLVTVGASLSIVLGLFFVVTWLLRRNMPATASLLPSEVLEVLGRTPLPHRQQIHLLRCGNKLLLVCVSAGGVETLTEITDPVEVDRLAGLCSRTQPNSQTAAFRQMLEQMGRERHAAGFVDDLITSPAGHREDAHA